MSGEKRALAVGDRVAVYTGGARHVLVSRKVGIIGEITLGSIRVDFDAGDSWSCHPKQVRRFVKRKRREFTLFLCDKTNHIAPGHRDDGKCPSCRELVHVIEAPRRKGGKA